MPLRFSCAFAIALGLSFLPPVISTSLADNKIGVVRENGVRHVTAQEAATLISSRPDLIVLDIRTPGEFKQGHIEGAIQIDYYGKNFVSQIRSLDPNADYLLYCRSGARSGRTLPLTVASGFKNISHLDHGFNAWKAAGLEVAR